MPNDKMLIDASHPEETRVVLLRGNRIEEFDFESQAKKQLRGNIYLAKVTRVEPSLQAAFVEYGGNRHGFLAFSEIHPDYYQIPYADRQALLAEDNEGEDDDTDNRRRRGNRGRNRDRGRGGANAPAAEPGPNAVSADALQPGDAEGAAINATVDNDADRSPEATATPSDEDLAADAEAGNGPKSIGADIETDSISEDAPPPDDDSADAEPEAQPEAKPRRRSRRRATPKAQAKPGKAEAAPDQLLPDPQPEPQAEAAGEQATAAEVAEQSASAGEPIGEPRPAVAENGDRAALDAGVGAEFEEEEHVESVGQEDALEELPQRRRSQRSYKIQEVIKRRQIMLVQVVKEERGNKGAALTTYLSLAGRYCVLMPNTGRGGGISRKITSAADRKRLKEIAGELEVPQGMGVILRTAGANRNKAEIRRDFEYLQRMWETVRNLTLASTAPCLVYEEGSLVKRSIRDLYDKDTGEVLVQGEAGYREAKDFMRMLMPSHAKNVKLYAEDQSIFARHNVEAQLDRLLTPQVTLKSGGYLVINQTEALVSIDVNSGKATREHSIEDTALKTNLEASDEIARQLRLRDLAGLIVIDFIDMEEKRNNRSVEKRLKDALKNDRARIQVGRISHFGLMEMSRQRIRVSVMESTMDVCPHCQGLGHVRSHSSIALHIFRSIEDHLMRHPRNDLTVRCPVAIALEILNTTRAGLSDLEMRHGVRVTISADASLPGQNFVLEKGEPATGTPRRAEPVAEPIEADEQFADEAEVENEELAGRQNIGAPGDDADAGNGRRKRRRRRGRRGGSDVRLDAREEASSQASEPAEADDEETGSKSARRRGRRGRRTHARDNPTFADNRAPDAIASEEGSEEIDGRQEADGGSEAGGLPDREPSTLPASGGDYLADVETRLADELASGESAAENSLQHARRHRNTRRGASAETSPKSPPVAPEPATAPEAEGKRSGWWRRGFF